jgi:hypothetical protein
MARADEPYLFAELIEAALPSGPEPDEETTSTPPPSDTRDQVRDDLRRIAQSLRSARALGTRNDPIVTLLPPDPDQIYEAIAVFERALDTLRRHAECDDDDNEDDDEGGDDDDGDDDQGNSGGHRGGHGSGQDG